MNIDSREGGTDDEGNSKRKERKEKKKRDKADKGESRY